MKIRVAVLFGGRTTEHEISIISAVQAMHAMDSDKYEIIPVYISKEGDFYTGDKLTEVQNFTDLKSVTDNSLRVNFVKEEDHVYLYRYPLKKFGENRVAEIDVAFPIVHGTNVEDGTLTGFLTMLSLPVVGCDVLASAIGMDKYVMKTVLKDAGLPVLDCRCFTWKDYKTPSVIMDQIEEAFPYPVIVKPLNLGSSIGIKKADNREELEEALELAFEFSKRILAEPAIRNLKEINCAVLGDYEETLPSECEEPVGYSGILGFEEKYMAGRGEGAKGTGGAKGSGAKTASYGGKLTAGAKSSGEAGMASLHRKLPADISAKKRKEIRSMAVKAFNALQCSGVSRIDFMLDMDDDEKVYFNEINTIPGSLAFYLFEAAGIPYNELIDRLITLALKADREKRRTVFSFDTNVLSGVRV